MVIYNDARVPFKRVSTYVRTYLCKGDAAMTTPKKRGIPYETVAEVCDRLVAVMCDMKATKSVI